MRITIKTESYNPHRYGKPWICKIIKWDTGKSYPNEIIWGGWIGSWGSKGTLEIEANPGDIIRYGQKDFRGNSHTYRNYALVHASGRIVDLSDSLAREWWYLTPEERLVADENLDHERAISKNEKIELEKTVNQKCRNDENFAMENSKIEHPIFWK